MLPLYLAGITERLELVTGILVLPQRQALLVARQAVDVDLLSGGRLRLGVGAGWNYVEFEALGEDFHSRGKRMSEQMALIRQLWCDPLLTFEGEFHRLDRVALNPRPRRRIPIYCGGVTAAAHRRAARLGDGFIFAGDFQKSVLPGWRQLQQFLDEEGRLADEFGADYHVRAGGDVEATLDQIQEWEAAGGSHAAVRTLDLGFTTVEHHIDHLAAVSERLGLR